MYLLFNSGFLHGVEKDMALWFSLMPLTVYLFNAYVKRLYSLKCPFLTDQISNAFGGEFIYIRIYQIPNECINNLPLLKEVYCTVKTCVLLFE